MTDFNEDTVYILDSYGLIYRCYFAFIRRPLTNKEGHNISALFGFFRNLHSVLTHYRPRYIAAALDSLTPTFRHTMYKEYKATRQKTPEDLHAQIPWIEDVLAALGVPALRCNGYEADDVIATIAEECDKEGRTCRILSGDKDLMQLVTPSTQILKPDQTDIWSVIGPEGVKAEWGVEPDLMLDLLSLTGDAADNIPGVPGVGIKTALKFLTQYGNLNGIYAHADEISGSAGDKIRNGKESAYFSQKLIRLCTDVPIAAIQSGNPNKGSLIETIQPVKFNYRAAADVLQKYGVPAVAKQYAKMAEETEHTLFSTTPAEDCRSVSKTAEASATGSSEEEIELKPLTKNSGDYKTVTELQTLKSFIDDVLSLENPTVAFDCETDSLDTHCAKLVGFSLCHKTGSAIYVPVILNSPLFSGHLISRKDALLQLERLFSNPAVTIIMHNGKFDYKVLRTAGIRFTNGTKPNVTPDSPPLCRIADTMIAAWLLEPEKTGRTPYSLEYLAETKLALAGTEYNDIVPKGSTFADVPLEQAAPYGAEDSDFTWQLWQHFKPLLENEKLYELFTNIEMRTLPVLAEMELSGIHLNKQALVDYRKELAGELDRTQRDIYEIVGHEFNISSTKQLQEVLFTERGLKTGKKTKTGYSTNISVLEDLAAWDPVPRMILDYRTLAKLQSTYVEALPALTDENSRIHTSFIQTGTATGRLSSRDPNLQNIPVRDDAGRRIRSAFTAIPGTVLISADYAQIELVVLAHLSSDPNLCQAFRDGTDVHRSTASLIYNVPPEDITPDMRRTAKTINFGVIYGMSAFRLSNELGIPRAKAASFIESYFKTYAQVRDFIDKTVRHAEQTGSVETIFGRKRQIRNINSRNKMEKAAAERVAVNTPIQGSAADIVKQAMINVDEALRKNGSGARMLLQVHDELILECPDDSATINSTVMLVRDCMEHAVQLRIPLRVSIELGTNWGEFH